MNIAALGFRHSFATTPISPVELFFSAWAKKEGR